MCNKQAIKLKSYQLPATSYKLTKGFTLIELLVVITLIGILSAVSISGFQAITRGARDALRKSDLEQIRSALEIYKSNSGSYPVLSATCTAGLSADYINPYPNDPRAPTWQYCFVRDSSLTYRLCAHMENGDQNDYCGGSNACGSNCNYQVTNP